MSEFLPPHGGQLRQIADRFGVPLPAFLDFSANVNPEGPPASVLSCLRKSLDCPSTLANYPDLEEEELRRSLARYAGVRPENVVAANGFVPLLDAALRVLPIQTCLVPVPAFIEYRKALERSRMAMIPLAPAPETAFAHDVDSLLSTSHHGILMANPQNPSGALCPRETLVRVVEHASRRSVQVLLDEAFIDYRPQSSLAGEIDRFPNLIIFRSVTKFFGMAGLRVAYALANEQRARQLRDALAPWAITTLASVATRVAVEDEPYCRRTMALNNARRSQLHTGIEALGIHVYPSAANFLLLRLPGSVDGQQSWEQLVRVHHIVLRNCANYEGLGDGHLRTAIRTDGENDRLLAALAQVLGRKGAACFTGKPQ